MNLNSFALKGQQLIKEGKFGEAEVEYNQAIAQEPGNFIYYASRAGIYNCIRQFEKAIADTKKSIELNANFSKSYIQQGYAYFNLKKYKDALESYKLALKLEPDNAQVKQYIKKVEGYVDEPEVSDGVILQFCLNRLASDPSYAKYLSDRQILSKLEIFTKSPQLREQLAQNDAEFDKALKYIFDEDREGRRPEEEEEEEHISNKEKEEPADKVEQLFQCWNKKSATVQLKPEARKGQPSSEMSEKAVDSTGERNEGARDEEVKSDAIAESYKIQGTDYYENKNYEAALQLFEKALSYSKGEILLYSNKAACYLQMEKFDLALKEAETALALIEELKITDPYKIARILTRKAAILDKMQRWEEALSAYRASLQYVKNEKIEEEIASLGKRLSESEVSALLQKGQELFKQSEFEQGLQFFEELSKKYPSNSQVLVLKSNCEVKLKKMKQAIESLNRALELDKKNVRAWAKKGHLHCILQDYQMALVCFEMGKDAAPNDQECTKGVLKCKEMINA